jgi:hypothetical protein
MDLAARPETKAAHTHSLNCAEADLQALLGGEMLNGASPSIRDAKKVVHWLKRPYVHYGQLYSANRDGHSNRKRTPKPPGWMDTEQSLRRRRQQLGQPGRGRAAGRRRQAHATRNPTTRALRLANESAPPHDREGHFLA